MSRKKKYEVVIPPSDARTSTTLGTPYPITGKRGQSMRPYRIWNAREKGTMRWHYFTDVAKARNKACLMVMNGIVEFNTVLEVFHVEHGRLLASYKMGPDGKIHTYRAPRS